MFKNTDKSFYLVRKILNVVYFVLMIASFITGIILIVCSVQTLPDYYYGATTYVDIGFLISGILTMLLGPVLWQFDWLITDMIFNSILDVKNIRNASYGLSVQELPAPLFMKKLKNRDANTNDVPDYEKLKEYKSLFDEKVITQEEFDEIRRKILGKKDNKVEAIDYDIMQVKKLKALLDENIITEEEYNEEKSKILKK